MNTLGAAQVCVCVHGVASELVYWCVQGVAASRALEQSPGDFMGPLMTQCAQVWH